MLKIFIYTVLSIFISAKPVLASENSFGNWDGDYHTADYYSPWISIQNFDDDTFKRTQWVTQTLTLPSKSGTLGTFRMIADLDYGQPYLVINGKSYYQTNFEGFSDWGVQYFDLKNIPFSGSINIEIQSRPYGGVIWGGPSNFPTIDNALFSSYVWSYGQPESLVQTRLPGAVLFNISYSGDTSPIPEPTSFSMLLIGLCFMLGIKKLNCITIKIF